MNAILTDIKTLIESGSSLKFGTDLFAGREPSSPDSTVTIFDLPGRGRLLYKAKDDSDPGSDAYEYAALQARIRNADYEKAMNQANEIVDILHGIGNQVVSGTLYTVIEAIDSPSLLEWDDNNRAKVIVNFQLQRRPN